MSGNEKEGPAESPEEEAFFQETPAEGPPPAEATPDEADPMGIGERTRTKQRGRRSRALFFLVVVLALGLLLIYWLHEDLFYFLKSSAPVDLGAAEELTAARLDHNEFVHVEGIARDMCIRADLFSGKVRFLYLLGSETGSRLLLESPVEGEERCLGAVDGVFEGRLVDLALTDRYDNVVAFYRKHFPAAPAKGPLYLLRTGEKPRSSWWIPLVFLVVLVLWGMNARTLWRLQRRPRTVDDEGGGS